MAQTYLNKKQELFCKFVAQGSTQLEAYELAGYEPSSANASTLANKPLIKERISELRQALEEDKLRFEGMRRAAAGDPVKLVEAAEWSFQRIMDMMAENVKLAQVAGEYKAANETLKMMGEAMKMFEKATAEKSTPKLPPAGSVTLIGQVTQMFEDAANSDAVIDNPLAPKR